MALCPESEVGDIGKGRHRTPRFNSVRAGGARAADNEHPEGQRGAPLAAAWATA